MTDTVEMPRRGYAWFVLFMMVLLYFINYVDRTLANALLEKIKASYGVSDTYMGFVIGPAFAFIYCVAAIPIARFADRSNRVKIIAAGAVVWSLFTITSGLSKTPELFALSRFGVGIGEAAFLAPAYSLLSDYFPPKRRALAFAIMNLGVYFGGAFGNIGGTMFAAQYDWHTTFLLLGAPGIILAVLTLIFVKEPERGRLDPEVQNLAPQEKLSVLFKTLMATPTFRYVTIAAVFGGFSSIAFGSWAIAMFERIFDISNQSAGARYGTAALLSGMCGVLLMGFLCDRLSKKSPRAPYILSSFGLLGFTLITIAMCFSNDVGLATALVYPSSLMGAGWVVAIYAALQDLLPAKLRATATSIFAFGLTFAGLVVGVMAVGWANDFFSAKYGTDAIRYSMALTLLTGLPASFYIFQAGKTADADRQSLAKSYG
ncbi:spinster family MFS transporter [Fretibacter rubidus]|uniref:spinster family MFS transporter n=1 Tax=Fretibacter rubidus TaxID=570162 RepID=UPI00352AFC49